MPSQNQQWTEGKEAYVSDVGEDGNPYPVGSQENSSWWSGWKHAEENDPLSDVNLGLGEAGDDAQ